MKKVMKRIVAFMMLAVVALSTVGCSGYENPEWLEQLLCEHDFDEEEIIKEPTCGTSGKKEKICSDCGKTETVSIKATGEHTWDSGTVVGDYVKYTCTTCDETKKEEIPECLHLDIDDVGIDAVLGTCRGCGINIFEATTVEVNVGDSASGWYRIPFSTDSYSALGSFSLSGTVYSNNENVDCSSASVVIDYLSNSSCTLQVVEFKLLNDWELLMSGYTYFSVVGSDSYVYFCVPESFDFEVSIEKIESGLILGSDVISITFSNCIFKTASFVEKVNI